MIIIILGGAPKMEPTTSLMDAFAMGLPPGKETFSSPDMMALLMVHLNRHTEGSLSPFMGDGLTSPERATWPSLQP